ncbi:MAG: TetR/AcrR family transcriptional regulator [Pseudomonadota bacterium]
MPHPDTPDRILAVARNLFVQQGYTATSMRQIAEAVGIGKATIYHHFPDKEAIALRLLDRDIARLFGALDGVRVETDPRRVLRAATEMGLGFLHESMDILVLVRREVPGGAQHMQQGMQRYFEALTGLLAEAIRAGTAAGIFRPVEPGAAARVLLTLLQGTFANVRLGGAPPSSPEATAAAILDIFLRGIEARRPCRVRAPAPRAGRRPSGRSGQRLR